MGVIAFMSIFSLKGKKERERASQQKLSKALIILSRITTTLLYF